jgi:DNA polymerase
MLVGEAPGADEVEEGEPLVGTAGRRLGSVLADVGVDRDRLYVTNAVKVRPEGGAAPRQPAVDAWWPVFEAELEAADPDVVVTLGDTESRELLSTDEEIAEIRGRPVERGGRTVVPTVHPAATFYDESRRGTLEADLRTALEETDDG